MTLSGSFATMPFADLLQWLSDSRRSGILAVMLEFEERYIRFVNGQIVAYGSDDPMARDLGRLCLRRQLVDEPGLIRAIAAQAESHMPLGDVLVATGLVSAEALEEAVHNHIAETVIGLFLWPEGRFTFSESAAANAAEVADWMPPEYELGEPIDTRHVLFEGMRRLDEWTRIVKVLPSDDAQVHALGPAEDLPILEDIAAHPEPPTLGALLGTKGDSRYAVCEQLFRAFERGLVAFEAGRERPLVTAGTSTTTVEHLVRAAESLLAERQYDEAAALLRSALSIDPFRADARALLHRSREAQLHELYVAMPRDQVPIVQKTMPADMNITLTPRERKLLSQINGRWDVGALALTTALGELETLRALRRLIYSGVVRLES